MNDPISRNRGKPSARRHVHPEFGVGARAPLTCQRSTHAQDRSLSVRLPSQRRLLRPEFNRWASNCEDRPVPEQVPRQRRLLSWAERRLGTPLYRSRGAAQTSAQLTSEKCRRRKGAGPKPRPKRYSSLGGNPDENSHLNAELIRRWGDPVSLGESPGDGLQ